MSSFETESGFQLAEPLQQSAQEMRDRLLAQLLLCGDAVGYGHASGATPIRIPG